MLHNVSLYVHRCLITRQFPPYTQHAFSRHSEEKALASQHVKQIGALRRRNIACRPERLGWQAKLVHQGCSQLRRQSKPSHYHDTSDTYELLTVLAYRYLFSRHHLAERKVGSQHTQGAEVDVVHGYHSRFNNFHPTQGRHHRNMMLAPALRLHDQHQRERHQVGNSTGDVGGMAPIIGESEVEGQTSRVRTAGTRGSRSAAGPTTRRCPYMNRSVVLTQEGTNPSKTSPRASATNHSSRSISNTPSLHLSIRECNNPFPFRHGCSRWTPQHCRGRRLEATELGLRLSKRRKRGAIFSAHGVLLYWLPVRVGGG